MKTSLEWLTDFLPGGLDAPALAETLTFAGLNVEHVEQRADDFILDIEVTSNRGDCLSHLGVARELAALLDRPFTPLAHALSRPAESPDAFDGLADPAPITVEVADPLLCPFYSARKIEGLRVGASPEWIIRRLEAVGIRPVNNVVDITNYVMFEMGQPLHAFDFARLAEGRILVRNARAGEKLTSIDGRERLLAPHMLVIADAQRPVALAGVMGGLDSEVSPTTSTILLESARFDPLTVRRTARALAMHSDSSYRFERQVDPTLPHRASLRACELILEVAGGRVVGPLISAGDEAPPPRNLILRFAKLHSVLGIDIEPKTVFGILRRLGLAATLHDDRVEAPAPTWRLDLNHEIDLVEEVIRVVGYDKVPIRDEIAIRLTPPDVPARAVESLRSSLIAAGCFEATTYSFVSDLLADDFTPTEAASLARAQPMTRKADARLRPSLLPGLLESLRRNQFNGVPDAALFEIGAVFWLDAKASIAEKRCVGIVAAGDLRDLRGMVEAALMRFDAARALRVEAEASPGFAPAAAGRIHWGGLPVGRIGLLSPAIAQKLSLTGDITIAELELDPLIAQFREVASLNPIPQFPAIRRDLSFLLAESIPYARIEAVIDALHLTDLDDLAYVTTYRGKPLDAGAKSVTVALLFRAPNRTLASAEVDAAVARAVDAVKAQLNASLRA